jgi:hypothetical protein
MFVIHNYKHSCGAIRKIAAAPQVAGISRSRRDRADSFLKTISAGAFERNDIYRGQRLAVRSQTYSSGIGDFTFS